MDVFNDYAYYYDFLYLDKDYSGEAAHVDTLLQNHAPGCASILELGCGNGKHAGLLAEKGYSLEAIDFSSKMIELAEERKKELAPGLAAKLNFGVGDVRNARFDRTFDAVISLFHVMSYQTGNDDVLQALQTAEIHLGPGGIFVFDVWYGPAVFTLKPEVRVKRYDHQDFTITRIAEPVHLVNKNVVEVNYEMIVQDKQSGKAKVFSEKHVMRYFFLPELLSLISSTEFELKYCKEWITGQELSEKTWGACLVLQKK